MQDGLGETYHQQPESWMIKGLTRSQSSVPDTRQDITNEISFILKTMLPDNHLYKLDRANDQS